MVTPIAPCSWCAMVHDRGDGAAHRDLRHRDRVVRLRAVEAVVRCCGCRQSRCRTGTFELTCHRGQRVGDRLELVQRPAELHPVAGMRGGECGGGLERADDLHAARPRAAAQQFVTHGGGQRDDVVEGDVELE